MNIGLTGTIGSGKSSVAAMLSFYLDALLLDTDRMCRDLLQPGAEGWLEIRKSWPESFFTADSSLDRRLLRETLASDRQMREKLEAILHPLVRRDVDAQCATSRNLGRNTVVEVPLLFEAGWEDGFDHIVAVYVPFAVALQRTVLRDGVSPEQTRRILAVQKSPEEKAIRAGSVIDNSGLWVQTVLQVSRLAHRLR